MSIHGKVALVTGAGQGIGRAIALRLASDGADIAVNDINSDAAAAVAKEVEAAGRASVALAGDVGDRDATFDMVETATQALGGLDVFVANAGVARTKTLLDTRPEDLDALFRVNVFGVLWSIQSAATHFRTQGRGGKIICAASIAGHSGFAYLGAYSATKFGVIALTQAAAKELAPDGITVNAYCPGIVDTQMWEQIDSSLGGYLDIGKGAALAEYSKLIALGRVQTPADVAAYVSYLAGPDSDYMTGQAGVIDGGIIMR